MKNIETEVEARILSSIQCFVSSRKAQNISQSMVACVNGVSLRTIQNFENYKSYNLKLYVFYQIMFGA